MAVAFLMCPMVVDPAGRHGSPVVMPKIIAPASLGGYTDQITADAGAQVNVSLPATNETPPRGYAFVKVRATTSTLQAINRDAEVDGFPGSRIDTSLATLTNPQKLALRNRLLFLRYTDAEINAAFPTGDLGNYTLRDFTRFVAQRMTQPRVIYLADGITPDVTRVAWDTPDQPQDSTTVANFIDAAL